MKKILSVILAVIMTVMFMATTCSAATITSGQLDSFRSMYLSGTSQSSLSLSAEYDKAANKVTVTYETNAFNDVVDPQVTIVAYLGNSIPTAATNYEYIDQLDYAVDQTGKGTIEFTPKSTIADDAIVTVMMGGTGIDTPAVASWTDVVKGDVNSKDGITIGDASLIAQHVVGKEILVGRGLKAADVNDKDGVTIGDASLIAQYVVGKINSFDQNQ